MMLAGAAHHVPTMIDGVNAVEGTGASLAISILRTALDTYRDITGA